MITTQDGLCRWLRERGVRISPSSVHHAVEAGMPTIRLPWAKKPRFDTDAVWTWLQASQDASPLVLAVRDKIWRQSRRSVA